VQIVDLETGLGVLPPGEKGELRVRGPHMMTGYRNRPQETAQIIRCGIVSNTRKLQRPYGIGLYRERNIIERASIRCCAKLAPRPSDPHLRFMTLDAGERAGSGSDTKLAALAAFRNRITA
jgi:acyl-CoA synthetase (AMP-forming)/AMP-acid ligase II